MGLFWKLLAGVFCFELGKGQQHNAARAVRLHDQRVVYVANRVYARTIAFLSHAKIGTGTTRMRLSDVVGESALRQFALSLSDLVKDELEQQP